jgi:hypothetical protein
VGNCARCGRLFLASRYGRVDGPNPYRTRYCSEECTKRPKKERPRRDCEHCGWSFTPTRSDAKFCSGACRVAAHRAKRGAEQP